MKFFLGIIFGFFGVEKNRVLRANPRVGCDTDWHLIDGICMKISPWLGDWRVRPAWSDITLLKNWDDAKLICENQDGYLATLRSLTQSNFVDDHTGVPFDAVF